MSKKKATILASHPELAMIVNGWKKEYGEGFVSIGPKYEKAKPISTGSTQLDAAIGVGGLPRGRIIEISGPESSGKTSFCLYVMAHYAEQYPEDKRPLAVIDMERTIETSLMKSLGLDPEEVLFVYPENAEHALQALVDLCASGAVSVILLDSIDALQSEEFLAKKIGAADMKGIAKLVGQTMRQISKTTIAKDTTVLLINQERDSMDMYGPKKTTPGGNAIKYYSSVRISTMQQKESPNLPGAFLMRVKLKKNKCGPPRTQEIEVDFVYAKGPDPYFGLIQLAKEYGLMRFAGSSVKYKLTAEGEEFDLCKGGKDGARDFLRANPDKFQELRNACLQFGVKKDDDTNEGFDPEDEGSPVEEDGTEATPAPAE